MSFAMAILMIFIGTALLWVATHGTDAATPWGVVQEIIGGLSGTGANAATAGAAAGAAVDDAAGVAAGEQ